MSEYVNFYIGNKTQKENKNIKICYTGDSWSRNTFIYQAFQEVMGNNFEVVKYKTENGYEEENWIAKEITKENLKDIILNLNDKLKKIKKNQDDIEKENTLTTQNKYDFAKINRNIYETYKATEFNHINNIEEINSIILNALEKYSGNCLENFTDILEELKEDEEYIEDAIKFYEHYLNRIEYNNNICLFAGIEASNPDGTNDFEW